MRNARLDEAQAGIKIARRNINNLRYVDDTTLMAESEEELTLDESERGKWKSWLKAQHSENEDHGTGCNTSWQVDEETVEIVSTILLFLFFRASESLWTVTAAMNLEDACSLGWKLWQAQTVY